MSLICTYDVSVKKIISKAVLEELVGCNSQKYQLKRIFLALLRA